jgi:hypothetical protein
VNAPGVEVHRRGVEEPGTNSLALSNSAMCSDNLKHEPTRKVAVHG